MTRRDRTLHRSLSIPWLAGLVCLVALSCGPPGRGDDDSADDDDDATDDDAGDDDAADDDDTGGDDDDAVDDDTADDDDSQTAPGEEEIWATIAVIHRETPDPLGGVVEGGLFQARLYDRDVAPTLDGVLRAPDQAETCSLTVHASADLTAGIDAAATLDAGTLLLWRPKLEIEFEPLEDAGEIYYESELDLGTELVFDDGYIIALGYGDFPGFDTSVAMPAELELTAPPANWCPQLKGDIHVQWSGGSAPDVEVILWTLDAGSGTVGVLACRATNDGAFTLPAAEVTQLSSQVPGGTPRLLVRHRNLESVNIDGVRRAWLSWGSDLERYCVN